MTLREYQDANLALAKFINPEADHTQPVADLHERAAMLAACLTGIHKSLKTLVLSPNNLSAAHTLLSLTFYALSCVGLDAEEIAKAGEADFRDFARSQGYDQ